MVGRYHLLDELREDPLGTLHLARLEGPNGFQRWAAVRRLHPYLSRDAALVHAFYEGARMAARIQHANVATIFDVSEADTFPPWMAFEYAHGETVVDVLGRAIDTRHTVPWDIACKIVSDAAYGVEAIHDLTRGDPNGRQVPRGPITPDRLVVTYEGKTKIFEACTPTTEDTLALPYVAPEATKGVVQPAADVFALGVILWELVAGRRLFAGDTGAETAALLEAHVVPSLKDFVRCPTKLNEILQCSLTRDPGARFQSPRAFAKALHGVVVGKGLVLTDDEVARWLHGVFEDRFEERQERLLSAANVTEVYQRGEVRFPPLAPDTLRDLEQPVAGVQLPVTRMVALEALEAEDAALARPPFEPSFEDVVPTRRAARSSAEHLAEPADLWPLPVLPLASATANKAPGDAGNVLVILGLLLLVAGVAVIVGRTMRSRDEAALASQQPAVARRGDIAVAPPSPPPGLGAVPAVVTAASSTTELAYASVIADAAAASPRAPRAALAGLAGRRAAPRSPPSIAPETGDSPPAQPAASPPMLSGLLTVVCTPACDQVLDGSANLGPSPVFKVEVKAGRHRLKLRTMDPPVEKIVSINVAAQDTTVVKQSMAE